MTAHTDPAALPAALTDQYQIISRYMSANKLVINDDKTHLLVLGSKAMKDKRDRVFMEAGHHTILPSKQEQLLGCTISEDMKLRQHIIGSEHSMIKQITSRVNGLAMISSGADFKTKLMVANGIVMSKLCYLVQLLRGCEGYLIHSLQVQLDKAARLVTGMCHFTPTIRLMKTCGWLTVKQLVKCLTILMVHKVINFQQAHVHVHQQQVRDRGLL